MFKKLLVLSLLTLLATTAFSQSLEENLSDMLSENATMYLQPLGDAFGASMNSGWYHRSRVHKMLGFDIGVKAMAAVVTPENRYFNFALNENEMAFDLDAIVGQDIDPVTLSFNDIYYETDTETPTFFGPADADSAGTLVVADDHLVTLFSNHLLAQLTPTLGATAAQMAVDAAAGDLIDFVGEIEDLPLPPGSGIPGMILPMPQLSIGLPMGLELTARGFPEMEIDSTIGMFSMYGGGLRLNIDQFIPIPLFPVDITAGAFYSQMKVGDILESTNTSVGLQVGKSISLLLFGFGIYADAAYEMSSLSIGYDVDPSLGMENDRVEFNMETEPGLRVGGGLHVTLIPFTYINAHVSQTPTNLTATVSAGITFR